MLFDNINQQQCYYIYCNSVSLYFPPTSKTLLCTWEYITFFPLRFRESIYRLLPQTTPENVSKNFSHYSVDPTTRYPNISLNFLKPSQVSIAANKLQGPSLSLLILHNRFKVSVKDNQSIDTRCRCATVCLEFQMCKINVYVAGEALL